MVSLELRDDRLQRLERQVVKRLMQLVVARPRVRGLDCCPDAPDAFAGGKVRQLQASCSPVGTKFPPALKRQLVPNLEEPLHHLPGSSMTDEVGLQRLGFVAECERA